MAVICLITPGQPSTNPRVVKEADALIQAGHEVRLVSCVYSEWAQAADREFEGRPWRCAHPVHFSSRASLTRRLVQRIRRVVCEALTRAGLDFAPLIQESAYHDVTYDLIHAAGKVKADLYIAHYVSALPAAARAARRHGGLYAFDAEDFHLDTGPPTSWSRFERRVIRGIESRYLPGCAYVTAASPGIADAYEAEYGVQKPLTVLNVFEKSLATKPASTTERPAGPSIYWFSQTIGPGRGLEAAVIAIGKAASRPHLYLRGVASEGFAAELHRLALEAGAPDHLHWLAVGSPDRMVELAALYDAGLASESPKTFNRAICLPNKPFVYLLAGLALVVSDTPGQRFLANQAGEAAIIYQADDADDLAAALDRLFLTPGALEAAKRKAYALGQTTFNWEAEQRILLTAVEDALAKRGAGQISA